MNGEQAFQFLLHANFFITPFPEVVDFSKLISQEWRFDGISGEVHERFWLRLMLGWVGGRGHEWLKFQMT